jgi:hypothetical protein
MMLMSVAPMLWQAYAMHCQTDDLARPWWTTPLLLGINIHWNGTILPPPPTTTITSIRPIRQQTSSPNLCKTHTHLPSCEAERFACRSQSNAPLVHPWQGPQRYVFMWFQHEVHLIRQPFCVPLPTTHHTLLSTPASQYPCRPPKDSSHPPPPTIHPPSKL